MAKDQKQEYNELLSIKEMALMLAEKVERLIEKKECPVSTQCQKGHKNIKATISSINDEQDSPLLQKLSALDKKRSERVIKAYYAKMKKRKDNFKKD